MPLFIRGAADQQPDIVRLRGQTCRFISIVRFSCRRQPEQCFSRGLAAAIAAADAARVNRVHVINRNRVRVDISDDLHEVGDYDEKGRHFVERFRGEPMYVIVTRAGGKWECGGAIITTY